MKPKFKKDDTVKIVDPIWGIEDPSEYKVVSSFILEDWMIGTTMMYELATSDGHRALIGEDMLRLVRSAPHKPTKQELADIFAAMDESARLASVDRLLEDRKYLMFHRDLRTEDDPERSRMEKEIEEIDAQLRAITFKKG